MNNELIIIVEDDLLIARDLKETLEKEGFKAISNIADYNSAVKSIQELKPSLVLIDINLSKTHEGIKIASYLNELNEIPFIFVTSCNDKASLEKVKKTKPYGYINKPFRDVDIITSIVLTLNNFKHRKIDPLRTDSKKTNDAPYKIRKVINYINENINDKIEVKELAEISNWKIHHFIRIFSSEIGTTPYKYILERKMEIAKALIESTDQPIQEISYDLNFQNYSNFYLAFRKRYKISPEAYRKHKIEN